MSSLINILKLVEKSFFRVAQKLLRLNNRRLSNIGKIWGNLRSKNQIFNQLQYKIVVAKDHTHHLLDGIPLYNRRFASVLKYHQPGLAPVVDESGAYHVDVYGNPAYPNRYTRTFGFYDGKAAVNSDGEWFHINSQGERLYKENYCWCGNYQDGVSVVRDKTGNYFHIDRAGNKLYKNKFAYAGDFKDGIAAVQNDEGLCTHIYLDGKQVHENWYQDLDVFHKGFARAKDLQGWCHINISGQPMYSERYDNVEPFYNGFARVEDRYGALLIIDETGKLVQTLKERSSSPLQQLSANLVGYWKTQTIKAAVELEIFEWLPNDETTLKSKINVPPSLLTRLLRALQELGLVFKENIQWNLTEKGIFLKKDHSLSLADAALHWATESYFAWSKLTYSLKTNQPAYPQKYGKSIFDWLDDNPEALKCYQSALKTYSEHDYANVASKIDLSEKKRIIDAAGGKGILLKKIMKKNSHLEGVLLERPLVVKNILSEEAKSQNLIVHEFDLFSKWPASGDAIFLSRVLHDWSDEKCINILKMAKEALLANGTIYVIEILLGKNNSHGGMLDLNMLVLTGGMERTKEHLALLAQSAGLKVTKAIPLEGLNFIISMER